MNDYVLCHHGIKGMKWGVVRDLRNRNKAKRVSKIEAKVSAKKKSAKPTYPSVKSLSDQDLKQILNRMDMEKRYNQMTAKEKTATQKFVNDVLTNAAKQTATKYTADYMSKGVEYLIKSSKKK